MVKAIGENTTQPHAAERPTSRWWLATDDERKRPAKKVSWPTLERGKAAGTFNRAETAYGRVGAELAFECGETLGRLQEERGFAPRWNGLLSLAAVPHRFHVLGVIGTIRHHWDRRLQGAWNDLRCVGEPVWDSLGDPDTDMDDGHMFSRALAMVAASAVGLENWENIVGADFFEERMVLARYSKLINAAWAQWYQAARENSFSYLPEEYEAACRLLKRSYDADDAPRAHLELAKYALCGAYNFGDIGAGAPFYMYNLEKISEMYEEVESDMSDGGPRERVYRPQIIPDYARRARDFAGS